MVILVDRNVVTTLTVGEARDKLNEALEYFEYCRNGGLDTRNPWLDVLKQASVYELARCGAFRTELRDSLRSAKTADESNAVWDEIRKVWAVEHWHRAHLDAIKEVR